MQENIWHKIKSKSKRKVKDFFYLKSSQLVISLIVALYVRFVVLTSRKTFYNNDHVKQLVKENKSFILTSWHNRIAIGSYAFLNSKKENKKFNFYAIASNHGDGMILGEFLRRFNFNIISGSTRKNNDLKKGMSLANFRQIFRLLNKDGSAICITPDGPRGPRFKVSGQIAAIAQKTSTPIIPTSFGISRRKIFNSWDKFILPLPFSKISLCLGDPIYIDKNSKDLVKENQKIEDAINSISRFSDESVNVNPLN